LSKKEDKQGIEGIEVAEPTINREQPEQPKPYL
jgi:hypothetical protein